MLTKKFYPNPVIKSMTYNSKNNELSITFAKSGQIRVYDCPANMAYGLFYKTTASQELEFYSNEIKKKCNVLTVK